MNGLNIYWLNFVGRYCSNAVEKTPIKLLGTFNAVYAKAESVRTDVNAVERQKKIHGCLKLKKSRHIECGGAKR